MRVGLRSAVNAKCKDCIYDPLANLGKWRQQVEACAAAACPLHPVRPLASTGPGRPLPGPDGANPYISSDSVSQDEDKYHDGTGKDIVAHLPGGASVSLPFNPADMAAADVGDITAAMSRHQNREQSC